jgi:hypothetical protein
MAKEKMVALSDFGRLHPGKGGVAFFMGTGKAPGDALPRNPVAIEAICRILLEAGKTKWKFRLNDIVFVTRGGLPKCAAVASKENTPESHSALWLAGEALASAEALTYDWIGNNG